MGRIKDITGKRFGKLVVTGIAPKQEKKQSAWYCKCDCGKKCIKRGTSLRYGWVQSCGCMRGLDRNPDYIPPIIKWIIRMYTGGAKTRNISFNLTNDQFVSIIKKPCHYCGYEGRDWGAIWYKEKLRRIERRVTKKLDERAKHVSFIGNGIDRLNNEREYNIKNCVSCCATCNMMKKNLTKKNFLNHISKIYNYKNKS